MNGSSSSSSTSSGKMTTRGKRVNAFESGSKQGGKHKLAEAVTTVVSTPVDLPLTSSTSAVFYAFNNHIDAEQALPKFDACEKVANCSRKLSLLVNPSKTQLVYNNLATNPSQFRKFILPLFLVQLYLSRMHVSS